MISGTHLIAVTRLTGSVYFCLLVCVIDIVGYIIYIIRERKNVRSYVAWGRMELKNYYTCLSEKRNAAMSRYSPGYHHSNSDDENDPNHRYLDSEYDTSSLPYKG